MNSVLVVCIGNICRSPMGQILLADALPGVTVTSAGIGALVGHPADPVAQELMAERGLDLDAHRARQINRAISQGSELILTMDDEQRRYIETTYPVTRGRVFRMCQAARADVPDPYRRGREAFVHARQMIDEGVADWAARIRKF